MPSAAPYQLWINGPAIASGVRVASTVTITTTAPHGVSTGSYVQVEGCLGTVGSSFNGVYQATVTSGSTFTYTSAGTAGTGITGGTALTYEAFAHDLLNPLVNYSGTARNTALYVPLDTIRMSMSGDGEPASLSFTANQDYTVGSDPWFESLPDNTRVRLVVTDTGSTPVAGKTIFRGYVTGFDTQLNNSGQGSTCDMSCSDVNGVFDRVVVYGRIKAR